MTTSKRRTFRMTGPKKTVAPQVQPHVKLGQLRVGLTLDLPRHPETISSIDEFGSGPWEIIELDLPGDTVTVRRRGAKFSAIDLPACLWKR